MDKLVVVQRCMFTVYKIWHKFHVDTMPHSLCLTYVYFLLFSGKLMFYQLILDNFR